MATDSLRGQNDILRFIIASVEQGGRRGGSSFVNVIEWNIEPNDEIPEEMIVGEDAARYDYQLMGFTLTWSIHKRDRAGHDYLTALYNSHTARTAPPDVVIRHETHYRDGSRPTVEVYEGVVMRMRNEQAPGMKEYVLSQWEAKGSSRKASNG